MIYIYDEKVYETDQKGEYILYGDVRANVLTVEGIRGDVHLSKLITPHVLGSTRTNRFVNSECALQRVHPHLSKLIVHTDKDGTGHKATPVDTAKYALNYDIRRVGAEELKETRRQEHSKYEQKVKDKILKTAVTNTTFNDIARLERKICVKEGGHFAEGYLEHMNDRVYSIYSACRGTLTFEQLVADHVMGSDIVSIIDYNAKRGGAASLSTQRSCLGSSRSPEPYTSS